MLGSNFNDVLEAITYRDKIFNDIAPLQIKNDKRYMSYFKDCNGCINGTHIAVCISETQQLRYIDRKEIPTFNVIATCDFDVCFTFASIRWEGSTHNTRVFLHAINTPSMNFLKPPEGKLSLLSLLFA
uniref:DDE Tnp4 domain-containing protein n=1 Tax=Lactuca sativa TaxID=4236 RepID=A0A9R1VGV1_LACSA|nr:hypothetical protein LSAT_V11C500284370 [Lactuca sativa]